MRTARRHILGTIVSIVVFSGSAFPGNLSIFGALTLPEGLCGGADWELRPLVGNFLTSEVIIAYAQGDAPTVPLDYPSRGGSSRQRYDYSEWTDIYGVAQLRVQGIIPQFPAYFALGIGAGPHFVGARRNYSYHSNPHYQWQFRYHGSVQVNLRLGSMVSVYTELEVNREFKDWQNPQEFPQGFVALKFGLRHSIQ